MMGLYITYAVVTLWCLCLQYGQGDYVIEGASCNLTSFPSNISTEETYVEIHKCPISEIEPGALDHLGKLEQLQMVYILAMTSFPNVTAVGDTLKRLLLFSNGIKYINPSFLNSLVKLERLNIARNQIACIPNVPGLKQLTRLYGRGNNFTHIPQLTEWTNVRVLDLSELDYLKGVSTKSFAWMANVSNLKLEYFKLRELPDLENVPNLKNLELTGSSLKLMPAHHTAVLGGLQELSLKDTVQLELVATLCSMQPHNLIVDVSGSGLKLCDCHHVWLKAAAEAGATVIVQQQVVCDGEDWTSMTTAHFLNHCHQHNHDGMRQISVTKRSSPLFCAFPRGVLQSDTDLESCILQCVTTKGCLSVNFRPTVPESIGECVLLAPSADGGYVQAVEEEEGWMLYGLVFDDII